MQAQRRGHLDDLPKSAAPLEPFEFCGTNNGSGSGRKQQAQTAPVPVPLSAAGALPAAPRSALLAQLAAGAGRPANTASAPLPPGTPPAGGGGVYATSAAQQKQGEPAQQAPAEKKKKKHGRLWRLMYGEHEGTGMHQPLW